MVGFIFKSSSSDLAIIFRLQQQNFAQSLAIPHFCLVKILLFSVFAFRWNIAVGLRDFSLLVVCWNLLSHLVAVGNFSVIVELKSAKWSTFLLFAGVWEGHKRERQVEMWQISWNSESTAVFDLNILFKNMARVDEFDAFLFSFHKFGFATNSSSICLKEQRNISFEMTESWATFSYSERERKTMSSSSKERDRKVLFGWKISEKMATRQFELRSFRLNSHSLKIFCLNRNLRVIVFQNPHQNKAMNENFEEISLIYKYLYFFDIRRGEKFRTFWAVIFKFKKKMSNHFSPFLFCCCVSDTK